MVRCCAGSGWAAAGSRPGGAAGWTPERVDLKAGTDAADLPGMSSDRGDIVLGWLTKLVATLAVLGVLGFDLLSLATARFQAEDHAQSAVRAASSAYRSTPSVQAAYDAAVAEVAPQGDTVDAASFQVGPDGRVTLTLHRTAATMLVDKVGALRGWTEVATTVSAAPAS